MYTRAGCLTLTDTATTIFLRACIAGPYLSGAFVSLGGLRTSGLPVVHALSDSTGSLDGRESYNIGRHLIHQTTKPYTSICIDCVMRNSRGWHY
jgi:hypothetical protein